MIASFKFFKLFDPSSTTNVVSATPTFDFAEDVDVKQNFSRTIGGQLNSYRVTNAFQFRYSLPLTFVTSADRFTIHNWWEEQKALVFEIKDDLDTDALNVRIVNKVQPLTTRSRSQFDLFDGVVRLHAIEGGEKTGVAWIWDDPLLGTWDNTTGLWS